MVPQPPFTCDVQPEDRQTLLAALRHYQKHLGSFESIPHLVEDERRRLIGLLHAIGDPHTSLTLERK